MPLDPDAPPACAVTCCKPPPTYEGCGGAKCNDLLPADFPGVCQADGTCTYARCHVDDQGVGAWKLGPPASCPGPECIAVGNTDTAAQKCNNFCCPSRGCILHMDLG